MRNLLAALAVLATACAHVGKVSEGPYTTAMGHNAMGHNAMGHNGLRNNGLGPGPGPSPLVCDPPDANGRRACRIDAARSPAFADWIDDSPEHPRWMAYFAGCAYARGVIVSFEHEGRRFGPWEGAYGLAAASLEAGERMTADESMWVTGCLLAHVNETGRSQYISLRGNPTDPLAREGLVATQGERFALGYREGAFMGDLYADLPRRITASLHLTADYGHEHDEVWIPPTVALGRTIAFESLTVPGPGGVEEPLVDCAGRFQDIEQSGGTRDAADPNDIDFPDEAVCERTAGAPVDAGGRFSCTEPHVEYRPIFVTFPRLANLESPLQAPDPTRAIQVLGSVESGQRVECTETALCVGPYRERILVSALPAGPTGAKLLRLSTTQELTAILREPPAYPSAQPAAVPPADQAFTAIIRYAAARPVGAAASLRLHEPGASPRDVPAAEFPSTGGSDSYAWFQVYPVHLVTDGEGSPARPALALSISGARRAAACGGEKELKGDGERARCARSRFDWGRFRWVCEAEAPDPLECAGDPAWRWWRLGWRCAGGGPAQRACRPEDAPELDAIGFVPGRPWCFRSDEPFAGVCPEDGAEPQRARASAGPTAAR
jgi:hypothetical protein